MDQAPPLHLDGWAIAYDADCDPNAEDDDRVGFAYHAQSGHPRDPEDGFADVHHQCFDRSAEYDLRIPDESTLVEVTRSASADVTSSIGK
eukprot:1658816-Pyramimonas_sp.AAC.1